ncbi:MAG TPA: phosphodiester glycosidase family protein [Gaiellaceae bacterium]
MVAAVLTPLCIVAYSYAVAMLKPSSLPLGIRSVEWVRANGGAWLVNDIENVYYRWAAPKKGGASLRALPAVGVAAAARAKGRPRPIRPLLQPALPGEGVWRSVGPPVDGAAPLLVTTFRPSRVYPRVVAYVAWIDHRRTQLALYPGRYEPPSRLPRGPMQVPYGDRWRLLATFNSGFTYRDGHGGFAVDGTTYTPLRYGIGTLVEHAGGQVDVAAWHGEASAPPGIVVARQNLPLIVDRGRPTPNLSNGREWGATLGNAVLVWRSGVGIDRQGNLVYAAADYQTVGSLAQILIRAGAVRAIELDINSEWPTFITYRHSGGLVPDKLVPNGQQPPSRYLRPDDRDFFAVYERPATTPLRAARTRPSRTASRTRATR